MSLKRHYITLLVSSSILIYPLLILFFSNPHTIEADQSLCPSKLITGLPCPGCGITKSILFFYSADIHKSLHYHLFGPLVIFLCVAVFLITLAELVLKKKILASGPKLKYAGYLLAFSLGAYHFFRLTHFIFNNSMGDILSQSIWK